MKNKDVKLFKIADIAVFLSVILLALALIIPTVIKPKGGVLILTVGEAQSSYSLDQSTVFPVESNGITLTVKIENGEAYIESTNCKSKLCKHSGKISKSGQTIVCAPAGVALVIKGNGGEQNEYDAVTG